ncbi:MAG: hypothetical protein LBH00_09180 [Planctomycetaceae bacterium]|nr:hypothetical protein [Planctomycetaceae bacterium]
MMRYFLSLFCPLFLSGIAAAAEEFPQPSPQMLGQVARLKAKNIPLVDYHIHLRGGMTAEKAFDWEKRTGIRSGVLENTGKGWPLSDNEKLATFIKDAKRFPLLVGIQVNDRDWYKTLSPENAKQIDYVLADTMIMALTPNGKPQKLWLENEYEIADPPAWLDRYFEHCLTVVNEPIQILANPTYLPPRMEKYSDEFWNTERMTKLIDAAVKNNVALEIQSPSKFPSNRFIEIARKKGAVLSVGRNNFDDRKDELKRPLDLLESLNIKPEEMFILKK